MATFGPTGKEVVMVVDRSGLHRAHTLASTLAHWQGRFRLQCLPARGGYHLNPMEGFWRVLKDKIGAGRCFLISNSFTGACVMCSWCIKSSPSMPAGGNTFRLVFYGFCFSMAPLSIGSFMVISFV